MISCLILILELQPPFKGWDQGLKFNLGNESSSHEIASPIVGIRLHILTLSKSWNGVGSLYSRQPSISTWIPISTYQPMTLVVSSRWCEWLINICDKCLKNSTTLIIKPKKSISKWTCPRREVCLISDKNLSCECLNIVHIHYFWNSNKFFLPVGRPWVDCVLNL